jgi:hypothetical protein
MMKGPSPEFVAKLMQELLPQGDQPPEAAPSGGDGKRRAETRWEERQRELSALHRQQAIDAVWETTLRAKAEAEAKVVHRSFHRAACDPDWPR